MTRISLALLLLLSAISKSFAGVDPPVIQVLDGSAGQVIDSATLMVEDAKFFDIAYDSLLIDPYPLRNMVSLEINEETNLVIQSNFTVTIRLGISFVRNNGTSGYEERNFTVNYSGSSNYAHKDVYIFSNCARVTVKILSRNKGGVPWDAYALVKVVNQLQSLPNYQFSCTSNAITTINDSAWAPNTGKDELPVYWSPSIGADEYDLEWTYIDSSSFASGRYGDTSSPDPFLIFDNNASRVTLKGTLYSIPLIYDNKGHLFFRVRPVQWQPGGGRNEADWSSGYTPNGLGRFYYNGHERPLNWQATTSYAEDGKRKIVIQYFDGSLRGRQTVTKDNSTNTTIVAESFYDYQGRPVIQVLPSPTMNSILKYNQSFNVGLNSNIYDKFNYDTLASAGQYCSSGAAPMDTLSGAARYYSSYNELKDSGFHKFIPDAKGYPFTEVEYTQDNTGRINRQSGVGDKFRISSGHETKYVYSTADQRELDALFGTEVGDGSHYFKTAVRDANGQYSISYTDMHGRTVATALAGVPPDSIRLDLLPSYTSAKRTEKLSGPGSTVIKDLIMESKKSLLVTRKDTLVFSYKLNKDSLKIEGCDVTVCYDCLYDLQITITDDCNNQKLPGGVPIDIVIRNFSIDSADMVCGNNGGFNYSFTQVLEEGNYEVTKKLSVSRSALDHYRDSIFMQTNACKNIDSFLTEQRQLLAAILQCKPTCETCTDSLGTWQQFWERYRRNTGIADADTASYKNMALTAYNAANEECALLCDSLTSEIDDIRRSMLIDMMPSSGQYANIINDNDQYSIFFTTEDINAPVTAAPYQQIHNYLDEDGNPDRVYDESSGALVTPDKLGPEAFAQKFKPSWAKALLPLHPEYCKLNWSDSLLRASHEWDRRFAAMDDWQEAKEKGYLNPTNENTAPFNYFNGDPGSLDTDPMSLVGDFKDQLELSLTQFRQITTSPGYITMWGLATVTVKCGDGLTSCYGQFFQPQYSWDTMYMCEGEMDMAWRAFRQMYLDEKRRIQNEWLSSVCSASPNATTLLTAGHQPHFSDAAEMLADNGITLPTDTVGVLQEYQQKIKNQYAATCKSYATQWWSQLAPCNFVLLRDSARIVDTLIRICIEGSDSYHPYGSSNIRPSSTYLWQSFEEYLKYYCEIDSISIPYNENCNAFLVTSPKPYDRQAVNSNKPIYHAPDSCECSQISAYYEKYEQSSGFASFASFMQGVYQTTIDTAGLNLIMGYCGIGGKPEPDCDVMEKPVYLPPAFQCSTGDVCITCDQFQDLKAEFYELFPGAFPAVSDTLITDSTHIRYNKLFADFMNNRTGFAKTADEYFAFANQCQVGWTGENCDSLQLLLADFKQNYVNNYGVTVDFGTQEGEHFTDLHDLIVNGAIQLPDTVRAKPGGFYNNIEFTQRGGKNFCWGPNGYSVELRWRYLQNAPVNGDAFFVNIGNMFALFKRYVNPVTVHGETYPKGIYLSAISDTLGNEYGADHGAVGFNLLLVDTNINSILNFNNYKFEVNPTSYRVYYNGNTVANIARSSSLAISNSAQIVLGLLGRYGNLDMIKMYDNNGQVKYYEDFLDADNPAVADNDYLCPSGVPDCQSAFVTWFNQQKGTSYNFTQINELYENSCSMGASPCSGTTPCNILADWQNDFKRYGGIPHFDAGGADTTHWKVNFGSSVFYRAAVPLGEVFKNGVAEMPGYYVDTIPYSQHDHVDFDYYHDTLCLDPAGFDFSLRVKLPDSLVIPNSFNDVWWIRLNSDPALSGNLLASLKKITGNGAGVCTHHSDPLAVCTPDSVGVQYFNDWRVIKLQFRGTQFRLYVDTFLMAQRTLTHPMTSIRSWTILQWAFKAKIDYVRITDTAGNYLFNEEFNDAKNLAQPDSSIRCENCAPRFVNYFNQRNGSNYSQSQIDSVYGACSVPLAACAQPLNPNLTLCGRAGPVFSQRKMGEVDNCSDSTFFIQSVAQELYKVYIDSLKNRFDSAYIAKCLQAYKLENFSVRRNVSEYHHTLYYYDQAGNLIKTVSPAGVKANYDSLWLDSVYTYRLNGQYKAPQHTLVTQYRYNTLNQVMAQKSPDGGKTEFWYDRLGRLTLSRNAKQRVASATMRHIFSYTRYDHLGRITEVGQLRDTAVNTGVSDALTRNESSLQNWFTQRSRYRHDITQTVYDTAYFTTPTALTLRQRNIRNRVSYVKLRTDTIGVSAAYNNGIFYSYDISGNVDTLLNDYGCNGCDASTDNMMNRNGNIWKKTVYNYDLISGKVNTVAYQRGYTDQFFQRYIYDAENRLILAESSRDSVVWEKEATYQYYKHGPLARTVIGHQQVQGIDYAYTLQGWLKGINSTGGTTTHDIGGDGLASGANQFTARDAIGVTLNYFTGDYFSINIGVMPFPGYSGFLGSLGNAYKPLYNGNISSMSIYNRRLGEIGAPGGALLFYNYRYDQLNRLTGMDVYADSSANDNSWVGMRIATDSLMKEKISYDANGNILTYRRDAATGPLMDNLTYKYYPGTNQLRQINDGVSDGAFPGADIIYDIDNQSDTSNYVYDSIGNLIQDKKELITGIKWNVYGKITEITRTSSGSVPVTNIKYFYDALGNRIGKIFDLNGTKQYTWYVRDAQGNVLSIYNAAGNGSLPSLGVTQVEQYLYGSSRLGFIANNQPVDNNGAGPGTMQFYSGGQISRGRKNYELTNHLGNVLAVVTDRKFGVSSGGSLNDYYNPQVVSATDYYPFGMAARITVNLTNYTRFGFNGKEFDWEVKAWQNQYDYGERIYDPRAGRFLSVDPITAEYPELTPYQFASNTPIQAIDLDGLEARRSTTTTTTGRGGNVRVMTEVEAMARATGQRLARGHQIQQERAGRFERARQEGLGIRGRMRRLEEGIRGYVAGVVQRAEAEFAPSGPIIKSPNEMSEAQRYAIYGSRTLDKNKTPQGVEEPPVTQNSNGGSGNFVYRGLSAADIKSIEAGEGISARNPNAINSASSHVAGKKDSRWISTTKSEEIAKQKFGEKGYIKIDLSKVSSDKVDISKGFPAQPGRISNYAKKDQEVLIEKHIPQSAIIKQ